MHCGSIRQTASIISMSKDCLRTGDKALIHFRFIKHPEYITSGQRMVFREVKNINGPSSRIYPYISIFQGRTKAVGNVVRIITHSTPTHQGIRAKQNKQQRLGTNHQGQGKSQNKKENLAQQEVSDICASTSEITLEEKVEKQMKEGQKVVGMLGGGGVVKKGRSRRGGRGRANNHQNLAANKLLPDVTNITPLQTSNRVPLK